MIDSPVIRLVPAACFSLVCAALAQMPKPRFGPVAFEGLAVTTAKHTITLAPTGLPAQIDIKADRHEIPLPKRGARQPSLSAAELRAIGRGAQLRGPLRIEAIIDGKTVVADSASPVRPTLADGTVVATARLAADRLPLELTTRYAADGAVSAALTYGAAGMKLDELALVIELDGAVDTIVPGKPVDDIVHAYRPAEFALPAQPGTAWRNVPPPDAGVAAFPPRELPGIVRHLWVGNGDRGFTWLCEDREGWAVNEGLPTMILTRDDKALVTWRIVFVNTPTTLTAPMTVRFRLLTHPATAKPEDHRRRSWLAWPHGDTVGLPFAVSATPPTQALALLRADSATVWEHSVGFSVLNGPAGGDAISAGLNLADTYPIELFRYLAGTHTGSVVRLCSNASDLCRPGMSPATDRMVIARALLHDIGLDASRLAHLELAAVVAKALHACGYFESDGMTEFIPYWRSEMVARYGETFSSDDPFATTLTDPLGRVYVSAYCRPGGDGKGRRTLFVVANEGDKPVRERFYVSDPNRVFGRQGNSVTAQSLMDRWDFSGIPDESDWRKDRLEKQARSHAGKPDDDCVVLHDLEDDGYVVRQVKKNNLEVYGPLFVAPHSFRLLRGEGE